MAVPAPVIQPVVVIGSVVAGLPYPPCLRQAPAEAAEDGEGDDADKEPSLYFGIQTRQIQTTTTTPTTTTTTTTTTFAHLYWFSDH